MALNSAVHRRWHVALLLSAAAILIWSGTYPRDRLTWVLEVFPVVIGGAILVATYNRFRFTNLVYALIWLHAVILMLGGHWTYAEMPVFDWLKDMFHWKRNYYDRLGHVAQGFVPALLVRELLLRTSAIGRGKWLFALSLACPLAVSAAYELFEWATALMLGQDADQFLGTQGDPWDTQWDMFLALMGGFGSLVLLGSYHDRSLESANREPPSAR